MTAADPVAERPDALMARLPFVEGIRAYAALIVVFGHALHGAGWLEQGGSFGDASWANRLLWLGWPGNEMVFLFLAVSGFSLCYSEDLRRARGLGQTIFSVFARRRAWRILPTYYAALALGYAVLLVVPRHLIAGLSALGPEPVTLDGVGAHLLLVHNLRRVWLYQGNGPLWSMAFEAQLYLLFPLLYVASRRFPPLLVGVAAALLDVAIHHVFPHLAVFGLLRWFALGITLAGVYRERWVRRLPLWLLSSVGLLALVVAYYRPSQLGGLKHDAVWGLAFALLLLAMSRHPASRANPCNARWARWLGLRSYSIYALHFPVLWLVYGGAVAGGLNLHRHMWLVPTGLAAAMAVAQIGFLVVERPALTRVRAVGLSVRQRQQRGEGVTAQRQFVEPNGPRE